MLHLYQPFYLISEWILQRETVNWYVRKWL